MNNRPYNESVIVPFAVRFKRPFPSVHFLLGHFRCDQHSFNDHLRHSTLAELGSDLWLARPAGQGGSTEFSTYFSSYRANWKHAIIDEQNQRLMCLDYEPPEDVPT